MGNNKIPSEETYKDNYNFHKNEENRSSFIKDEDKKLALIIREGEYTSESLDEKCRAAIRNNWGTIGKTMAVIVGTITGVVTTIYMILKILSGSFD